MKTLTILDMYCAGSLLVAGAKLTKVTNNGGITAFDFDDTDGAASRGLGEWRNRRTFVNAREYAQSLRAIKKLIYISRQTAPIIAENSNDYAASGSHQS